MNLLCQKETESDTGRRGPPAPSGAASDPTETRNARQEKNGESIREFLARW
jgi:hypothetical protein